jgi:hypothetical protein
MNYGAPFLLFDGLAYALKLMIHVLKLCNSIQEKFPYLVQKKRKEGSEIRRVAQIAWNIIKDDCNQPFFASGLKFTPLPVNFHHLCTYVKNAILLLYKDLTVFVWM